jgi:ubiquinone/menaquinone biosynthesis C-methylase UbiE
MAGRQRQQFIPALRFDALTWIYDPVVALTSREGAFKRRLLDHAKVKDGERVLDLACGTGTLAIDTKARAPGAKVAALDADPAILERARRKAEQAGADIDFTEGLSTELPYENRTFDVVLNTLFFHHLTDEAKADSAEEIWRVLKPGGRLLMADWGSPHDPVMRLAFLSVQLLDGFRTTSSNVGGRIPEILRDAGLKRVTVLSRMRTPVGTIEIVRGTRPTR